MQDLCDQVKRNSVYCSLDMAFNKIKTMTISNQRETTMNTTVCEDTLEQVESFSYPDMRHIITDDGRCEA